MTQVIYTDLRKRERVRLKDAVPLMAPFTIYVETTNICNFKCLFCPESFPDYYEKSGGMHSISMSDFKYISSQILSIGRLKTLHFYMMGEPFVNTNLCDMISSAKHDELADNLIVTTNGTLLREAYREKICSSGLDYLRLSIYGGNQSLHAKRTQNKIPLARIRDNIAALKYHRDASGGIKPFIYIKMIKSEDSEENQSFLDMFSPHADEIGLEPVMNWNDPGEGNLSGVDTDDLMQTGYFAGKKDCCPFPFYTLVIHADFQVSVCCVDWDKKTVVGNLRSESLLEIWRGQRLRDFQTKHLEHRRSELPGCRECTFLHTAPDNIDNLTSTEFLERRLGRNLADGRPSQRA